MRNVLINAIWEMIRSDKNTYLLTGDLGWGVFDDLLRDFPEQCINVGIAEQNMIGIAAGLALDWKKVFCYSIVPFITMRSYEQVRVDICSHNLDVTLIGVGGWFAYGMLGNTHYGIEDINVMRWLPNMTIFCPIDKKEIIAGIDYICQNKGPMYIRLNRWGEPDIIQDTIRIDNIEEWVCLYDSWEDILILSTWRIGWNAHEVATSLWNKWHAVKHITVPIVKPINEKFLLNEISKSRAVFVIEEHSIYGWLGSTIAELIAEKWFAKIFKRFWISDQFFYVAWDQEYMKNEAGISSEKIINSINILLHE